MKNKRVIILIVLIFLIGFTVAYFSNSSGLENIFNSNKYSTMTTENFIAPSNWKPGDTVDKTFQVTNNGIDDIAVRIVYSEEWLDKNNNIISNTQNNENIAIVNFANNNDWVFYNGYYYYKYVLKRNNTTSSFIDSVTFNQNVEYFINCNNSSNKNVCKYSIGDYDNATYKLTFVVETVQFDMYKSAWNTALELINN